MMARLFRHHGRRRKAFTLVELLVVLALLAIVAALVIPTLTWGVAVARREKCKANLARLAQAFQAYRAAVQMHTRLPFSVSDQWPLHLISYLGADAYALRCDEDHEAVPYFQTIQLRREKLVPWNHPEWDLHLFTTQPVWEQCALSEWTGQLPGVWKVNEAQYQDLALQESLNITSMLPKYEPGENPDVYYYLVEDLRYGDPWGESYATGDLDYEDVVVRVEETANGTRKLDLTIGHTGYAFGIISPFEERRDLHGSGSQFSFEFEGLGAQSYGMNWHADNFRTDYHKILALDYDEDVVYTGTDESAERWEVHKAPRHLGKCNIVYDGGAVETRSLDEIDPTVPANREEFWNPPDVVEDDG